MNDDELRQEEPPYEAVAPSREESRLSLAQGGLQLSASDISSNSLHEGEQGFPSDEDEEAKKAVKPPHGWPPLRDFPMWYFRRLTGFDQSLDVYGFYPSFDQLIGFLFTCITMVVFAMIDYYGFWPIKNHSFAVFIPAFGASCTVVFAVPKAPIAQPRCVIAAHVSAAVIGIALTNAFRSVHDPVQPFGQHCAGAIGVAIHLVFMQFTNLMHPPASATVITAATAAMNVYYQDEGFIFCLTPTLFGSIIVVVMSWLLNNLVESRSPYPQFW